jgi:hypothetical protein
MSNPEEESGILFIMTGSKKTDWKTGAAQGTRQDVRSWEQLTHVID